MSWTLGAPSAGSHDAGSACSGADEFKIPSGLSHLTDWSTNCLTVDNNLCVNGTITSNNGGVYSASDERLKENIKPVSLDELRKVKNIPLKTFNFKSDPTKREMFGIIAQDAEAAGMEMLVHTDEEGMKAVDYTSFLIARIAYLENVIGLFNAKLAELEKKIK